MSGEFPSSDVEDLLALQITLLPHKAMTPLSAILGTPANHITTHRQTPKWCLCASYPIGQVSLFTTGTVAKSDLIYYKSLKIN